MGVDTQVLKEVVGLESGQHMTASKEQIVWTRGRHMTVTKKLVCGLGVGIQQR